eukprot:scaffold22910_cov206-Cylindrotheca_fusiformis.AAC.1
MNGWMKILSVVIYLNNAPPHNDSIVPLGKRRSDYCSSRDEKIGRNPKWDLLFLSTILVYSSIIPAQAHFSKTKLSRNELHSQSTNRLRPCRHP